MAGYRNRIHNSAPVRRPLRFRADLIDDHSVASLSLSHARVELKETGQMSSLKLLLHSYAHLFRPYQ